MNGLRRRYVEVAGRLVHLRSAGAGPPLVLLHQSPRSSEELEPLMAALAAQFEVIAPDTPGNGLSDPLPARQVEIERFAEALAGLFDAIGLPRAGVYGVHTGAAIGAAFAARYPERVAFALLNGVPCFDAAERAELIGRYLPPFEPAWDGSHLAWLWARLREQTIFFPWYETRTSARMAYDAPSPAAMQAGVLDFLRAGETYRVPYRAALSFDGRSIAAAWSERVQVVATARDPLRPHLDRLGAAISAARVAEIAPGLKPVIEALVARRDRIDGARPAWPAPLPQARFVEGPTGPLHLRGYGDPGAAPLVLVHDLFGSGADLARIAQAASRTRFVLTPDLPGHGESAAAGEAPLPALAGALTRLGEDAREVRALGAARRLLDGGAEALRPMLRDPPAPPEADAWGGSLLRAWQVVRDRRLFAPGRPRTIQHRVLDAPPTDLAQLQTELTSYLQCADLRRRFDEDAVARCADPAPLDPNAWR